MIKLVVPMYNVGLFFSHGMQSLSAGLVECGIEHSVYTIEDDSVPIEKTVSEILADNPKAVCFTSTSFEFDFINKLAGAISKKSDCTLVLGGVHAIMNSLSILDSNFHYYCICEAEMVFPRFCLHLEKYKEPPSLMAGFLNKYRAMPFGLVWEALVPENLDIDLPDYSRGLLPLTEILDERDGWLSVLVSRGCPYNCSFCANSILRKTFSGYHFCRKMSPYKAIEHILRLLSKLGDVKMINFDDDNLLSDINWLRVFLKLYSEHIYSKTGIGFVCNGKASHVNYQSVQWLGEAGCYELQMSVETGNEEVRNKILGKRLTDAQLEQAFTTCYDYGLRTLAYVMHGVPFTSNGDCEKTAELVKLLRPTLVRDTYCYPFRGSRLRELCDEANIKVEIPDGCYFNEPAIKGHMGEKQKFRRLIESDYEMFTGNTDYLVKKNV